MEEVAHPVPVLFALLVALAACFVALRALRASTVAGPRALWASPSGDATGWWLVGLLSLLASYPLITGFGTLTSARAGLPGDASPHARAALEIARNGLPHGWVDAHNGGYLFGPHYQSLPILWLATLIRLGASAKAATQGTGIAAMVLLPLVFVAVARKANARPAAALLGALVLAWAAPFQDFIGGPRVYLSPGVLSQAVAAPLVLIAGSAVLGGRPRGAGPVLAAVCIATHAQITLCAIGAALPAVLLAGTPALRRRFALACAGAGTAGVALYGPGIRSLAVPMGWAKVPDFVLLGYHPNRIPSWILDGKLFDMGRPPTLTTLTVIAAMVLLLLARGPAARGALALMTTSLGLSVSGYALAGLGPLGARVTDIFSPVRMLCIVPIAAAVMVCTALQEGMGRARQVGCPAWLARAPVGAMFAVIVWTAGVPTLQWLRARVAAEATSLGDRCGLGPAGGYATADVATWIAGLHGGRLAIDSDSFPSGCPIARGLELETSLPPGVGLGGPGSQVGVNLLAFEELHATRPGGAARAEALGVRYVLHTTAHRPADSAQFHVLADHGRVELSERVGGSDRVGAGCVVARWQGSDRALREALFEDLSSASPVTADPRALTVLTAGEGSLVREAVERGACDAGSAVVHERPREPGAFEADVRSLAEVFVVVRATYVPTWTVRVDGAIVQPLRIAPGFLAVRVPKGEHRVEAVVSPPPGYAAGLASALALVALLAWLDWRHHARQRHHARH